MSFRSLSALTVLFLALNGGMAFAQSSPDVPLQPELQALDSLFLEDGLKQMGPPDMDENGPQGGGRLMEQLGLSTQQQQQMQAIRQRYQPQMQQRRQAVQAAHERLRELMSGSASADQVRSQHQEVSRLMQELGELRFESMLEMREVLTPEQRTRFDQLMRQNKPNRGGGGGRGPR